LEILKRRVILNLEKHVLLGIEPTEKKAVISVTNS